MLVTCGVDVPCRCSVGVEGEGCVGIHGRHCAGVRGEVNTRNYRHAKIPSVKNENTEATCSNFVSLAETFSSG